MVSYSKAHLKGKKHNKTGRTVSPLLIEELLEKIMLAKSKEELWILRSVSFGKNNGKTLRQIWWHTTE
jgi:hypothetical protein